MRVAIISGGDAAEFVEVGVLAAQENARAIVSLGMTLYATYEAFHPNDIKPHTDPASRVHKTNLAQQVCAECHASVRLTRR